MIPVVDSNNGYNQKDTCCYYTMIAVIFISECTDGFFGRNCQEKCNETCLSCNMFNGVCDKGCRPGWEGNYCQSGMFNV